MFQKGFFMRWTFLKTSIIDCRYNGVNRNEDIYGHVSAKSTFIIHFPFVKYLFDLTRGVSNP